MRSFSRKAYPDLYVTLPHRSCSIPLRNCPMELWLMLPNAPSSMALVTPSRCRNFLIPAANSGQVSCTTVVFTPTTATMRLMSSSASRFLSAPPLLPFPPSASSVLAYFVGTIKMSVASGAFADMRFPPPPPALFDDLFSTPFAITLLFGFVISAKDSTLAASFAAAGVASLGRIRRKDVRVLW